MSIILQDINFIQPQHFLTQINKALPSLSKKDLSLVDFYKSVSNTIKEFNLPNCFAQHLEMMDQQFLQSAYRKSHYIVKEIRERTIVSSIGVIRFKRRVYLHNQTGTRYYYIDQLLELRRYQRICDELLFQMIEHLIIEKTSYQKITSRYNVSRTTLYNGLKNLTLEDTHQAILKPIKGNTLYIQADEHYVSAQKQRKSKKFMIKQVTVFEGIEPVCKGRFKLTNRLCFTQTFDETNQRFKERIQDVITQLLASNKQNNLVLRGDGANWIVGLAQEIGCDFIIDGFHFKQALSKCIPKEFKKSMDILMSYLENNNLKGFKKIIKSLHDVEQLSDLPQSIQENFKYIQKHSPSYFKALKLGLPGCSAEGHISHYLASQLTRHPKAYNPSIAYTTAALISMAHNGIPLTKFLNKMKFHYYQPCIETPNSASYYDIYKAQDRYETYKLNYRNKPTLEKELMRNNS